jgi:hypothetical protein
VKIDGKTLGQVVIRAKRKAVASRSPNNKAATARERRTSLEEIGLAR